MALWKKILISLIAIFVFIGIIGFFILPAVIKPIAVEQLAALLHRKVTIEKVSINPYALSVIIRGFKISNPAPSTNPFIAFDELYLNLHGEEHQRYLRLQFLQNPQQDVSKLVS